MAEMNYTTAKEFLKDNTMMLSFLFFVIIILIFKSEIREKAHYLFLVYFIISLVNRIDSRYSVGAGLLLLAYTAVLLVQKKEDFANQIAIYAYYFLVVGVVLQLVEYIREGGEKEIEAEERARGLKMPVVEKTGKPRFIAVASGKGGVGKTTIAANLGVALSRLGRKVLLMDMDLAMPNLEIITGLRTPPVGLIDVLEEKLELERVTYVGPEGMKVIPSGVILDGYSGKAGRIKKLIGGILGYEFVILDMPPGREAIVIMDSRVEALLVVNPDKASILDALNMKLLLEKKGARVLGAVLNRSEGDEKFWIEEIEKVLETSVVAVIPESRMIKQAFEREECFVEVEPESGPSMEIMRLAEELAGG
jgi:septum site-determining protein MinD